MLRDKLESFKELRNYGEVRELGKVGRTLRSYAEICEGSGKLDSFRNFHKGPGKLENYEKLRRSWRNFVEVRANSG